MAYCVFGDVNLLTNITNDDVANADVTSIIADATIELNSLINVRVTRELVLYIDPVRANEIDGSNTIFYVRNWEGKFLADFNNDGSITTADVIVYLIDSNDNETTATISAVDSDDGKITLSSAPSSDTKVYITYEWCYRDPSTPDKWIKLACVFLTGAYCYAKLNIGRAPQVKFGNTRFYRHIESFEMYYKRAMTFINKINESGGLATWEESPVV